MLVIKFYCRLGGLTLKDIDTIYFEEEQPSKRSITKMRVNGIKWELIEKRALIMYDDEIPNW
jgi:hypothetical protein